MMSKQREEQRSQNSQVHSKDPRIKRRKDDTQERNNASKQKNDTQKNVKTGKEK
jgi:hypothetical protein